MKKLIFLLFVILLSGCMSMHYGNFTQSSPEKDIYLAKDAANQLVRVYPPALNTFYISQRVNDDFGIHLMHEMRTKGYGVMEHVQPKQKANFFYVVDEIEPKHLYRVSLYIGSKTLSRVYAKTQDKLVPVSAWSHKE